MSKLPNTEEFRFVVVILIVVMLWFIAAVVGSK